jgi:hypothetical protein
MLTFTVHPTEPNKGKFGITFLPADGERSAGELQVTLDDRRAQFGPGTQKSLREGGAPQGAGNYAIENLTGIAGPFTVCVIVKGDDKIGGTLIDAEIAGQRTMLTYRADLAVKKMVFRTTGVELKDVQVLPVKQETN